MLSLCLLQNISSITNNDKILNYFDEDVVVCNPAKSTSDGTRHGTNKVLFAIVMNTIMSAVLLISVELVMTMMIPGKSPDAQLDPLTYGLERRQCRRSC
jgi:hypothetical protein